MTEETRTHYRKAFDSPYLSSADIVDPVVLTIKRVTLETDRTKKTKDAFNTAWFEERELRPGERLKPMILNATNSKFMAALTGSKWIDDWAGVQVAVYVDGAVRFGKETVEGLRLAPPESSMVKSKREDVGAWIKRARATQTDAEAAEVWQAGGKAIMATKNRADYVAFKDAVVTHRQALKDNAKPIRMPEDAEDVDPEFLAAYTAAQEPSDA